jgi:hypothetical protein
VHISRQILLCSSVLLLAPAAAFASCDSLKEKVDGNLKTKNFAYSLTVEDAPADASKLDGKIVGKCDGDKKVVVYKRGAAAKAPPPAAEAAPAAPAAAATPAAPAASAAAPEPAKK